ncbi:hypothetical protein [Aquamicrobium zhengzhouense]|uniref:Uncharacterized protein n=1 Tax=Aquamicrobium zhengzhouense TaxID=2781738 RepID=A0ABS0SBX8_9HYPH|nr:hypothetical protein [Aquamicrobium zhengzhouense]MBI1620803.1 hypothetical protein [Aquamicrobium zhengzhouense]
MLKRIKKLLLTGHLPTIEQIDQTTASIDVPSLEAALAAAQEKRAALLLDGTTDQILAAEREIDEARIALERAQVALAELDRRRSEAEIRDREDAFLARRDACEARRVALIERLNGEVAKAAQAVEEAFEEMAAVEAEITEISQAVSKEVLEGNRIETATIPETFQTWLSENEDYPGWMRSHIERVIHHNRRHLRFWE